MRRTRSSSSIGTPKLFEWPDVKPKLSSVSLLGNNNFDRSTTFSSRSSAVGNSNVVCFGAGCGNLRREFGFV